MTISEAIKMYPDKDAGAIAAIGNWSRKAVRTQRHRDKLKAEISAEHPGLSVESEAAGFPLGKVGAYWWKGKHYSVYVRGEQPEEKTYEDLKDAIIEQMKEHSPKWPAREFSNIIDGHCLLIDPADVHINKLALAYETGEDYDSQIAVKRVREGVNGILNKAKGFPIDKVVLIIGNDILNADGPSNATTKGTLQSTDTLWFNAFLMAFGIYTETIEKLASIAPLHIMFNPSNHDVMTGFFLAHSLQCFFHNVKSITFDVSIAHRKYTRYHENIIGTTHGDAAKPKDLPMLMAQETGINFAECKHRYIFTHHIHHKDAKDYGSVTVESMRSPSGADGWHSRNGFAHAPKAIEGFIFSKTHGQIARLTEIFTVALMFALHCL